MSRARGNHDARRSDAGAIMIHVAIALLALLVFSAFIVDYGVMWVSRRQAQNAADAGALAGAFSLPANGGTNADATAAAVAFAQKTPIWGQTLSASDIVVSPLPFTCPASAGGGNACIRVDVFRGVPDRTNTPHTNTLPVFFGGMAGVASQGVRATATAQVAAGNAVTCIKPWIVADKWIDGDEAPIGGWSQNDTYNPPTDTYSAPGFKASGSNNDYGLELALKQGTVGDWSAGWTQQIDFSSYGGNGGSSDYAATIRGCPTWVPQVGLYDGSIPCGGSGDQPGNPGRGCVDIKTGMAAGPTQNAVDYLVSLDPSATWNAATNSVQGGCMSTGTCTNADGVPISPRIVPIAIFNTAAYYNEVTSNACNGSNCVAQIVNLIGFFVEGMCDEVYPNAATRPAWCGTPSQAKNVVMGRLMDYPGLSLGSAGSATPSSFVVVTRLVQ